MSTGNNTLEAINPLDKAYELTWNEILYDGGLATRGARASFRWLTICVCLIGIVGNILAVYTLLRRRMRTLSTYTYLTALSVSNIVTQISIIIFEVEIFIAPNHLNCLVASIAKAIASSTFALSTWITVGFTVDRYVMICFPFTGKHKCTRRNAIYIIIICLFISLTYLIPQLLAQLCHPLVPTSMNNVEDLSSTLSDVPMLAIYWVTSLSDIGKSPAYRLTITLFFNCILIRIVPFLVVFQLNFLLIKAVARTRQRHRQINPFEENRNDVTYMLVIVISMYLFCVIPSIPFAAFFAYDPRQYIEISLHYRIFQYMDEFTKFLMVLNSALQCYLYIFFGKRFRRELSRILCYLCVKYFHTPIPESYSDDDRHRFSRDVSNPIDAMELVLEGEWSTNKEQDTITRIEFNVHYEKQANRVALPDGLILPSEVNEKGNRIRVTSLKPLYRSC